MIRWMLRRLEHNPRATFSEQELAEFGDAFDRAKNVGLVRSSAEFSEHLLAGDRLLTVHALDDGLEALDEEDPAFDAVPIELSAVRRWYADPDALIQVMREASGLIGPFGKLTERLWVVGTYESLIGSAVVVVAFLRSTDAGRELRGLPPLLPPEAEALVVCCPSYAPSAKDLLGLGRLSIHCASFAGDSMAVAWPPAVRLTATRTGGQRPRQHGSGRPRGTGIGAMLLCWMKCGLATDRFDSTPDFYDAAFAYLESRSLLGSPPSTRESLPRRVSDARRARGDGRCVFRGHGSGVPPDLLPD